MINIYPANRMEDLLTLFDKVQQTSNLPTLAQEFVLVQNPGMQHWLNMQQANMSGIAMNAAFVLPAQFLWKQLKVLSGQTESDQEPYSREVLAWRIDKLLQCESVLASELCAPATLYWQSKGVEDPLKRFQLAVQLADLFEQYLIYRPNWVNAWASGEPCNDSHLNAIPDAGWQAHIWYLLQKDIPYNPVELITLAVTNVDKNKHLLPKRISIFGINALAPMWIDFLELLSSVIDIHFYHLNPCYEYWADIQTDKNKAKQGYLAQIERWPEDGVNKDAANPLLANLGQQGREFLSLLHQTDNIEIPIFDELFIDSSDDELITKEQSLISSPTVLKQIQKDILTLTDKRENPIKAIDNSITITSAHSALREVQGLHDYLLHLFNQEANNTTNSEDKLTPKDVLVMCPQIEQYAPYIDSVFVRGWEDIGENIPPLPCSIADRVSKDSEPLVAAFNELLLLPDSRFQVSQVLSFLRLLPLQLRFGFSESDIELISDWLHKANVHWGLDKDHKNNILGIDNANEQFTWQQGLNRLILGFAYSDETSLFQDDMVLPWVEGNNGVILGKLMQLCEQLVAMSRKLNEPKTATQWQDELNYYLEKLFVDHDFDNGYNIISEAISELGDFCEKANYTDKIELAVIRDFLNSHFSQPDPGRQFMIGQITFCSMLPMRSIPFKVIAILGLNDGEYPRQRQPLGFDLMAMTPVKPGDRSRKGDDRYLFLEALISARENLYLSYQGNDIKNNNERQPSIVLRELMDYLQGGYLWEFSAKDELRQLPLQVFSLNNFSTANRFQSFDDKWLMLALANQTEDVEQKIPSLPKLEEPITEINLNQLQRFLTNPCKEFAQQRLKLFLDHYDDSLDDVEPFALNFLDKYLFQQDVLLTVQSDAQQNDCQPSEALNTLTTFALRSGNFPDTPLTNDILTTWQQLMVSFNVAIKNKLASVVSTEQVGTLLQQQKNSHKIVVNVDELQVTVKAELQQFEVKQSDNTTDGVDKHIVQWKSRPTTAKAKDFTLLYLQHVFSCAVNQDTKTTTYGFYVNEKKNLFQTVRFSHIDNALAQLEQYCAQYLRGLNTPLLINSDIAHAHYWHKDAFVYNEISQDVFTNLWQGNQYVPGLCCEPYLQYFWSSVPAICDYAQLFENLYVPLYQSVEFFSESLSLRSEIPIEETGNGTVKGNT